MSMIIRTIILCAMMMALLPEKNGAQELITNVYGRDIKLLNGKWNAIVDQYDQGVRMEIFKNRKPEGKTDFYEYSFDGAKRLNVPGDWNSQSEELQRYEGTVWYQRTFDVALNKYKRYLLYFAGVSSRCNVYLNGNKIATHEGSFTPFQVDVTKMLDDGRNLLVVEVNNSRRVNAIPAMAFDWWNYGGITRDVMLVELNDVYVSQYSLTLDRKHRDVIHVNASLSLPIDNEKIVLQIPELGKKVSMLTGRDGKACADVKVNNLQRWSPDNPKLYAVTLTFRDDEVSEDIGFRNIDVSEEKVFLNGKEIFLRSVSFHEEIPQRMGRAYSEGDAEMLLREAKALGVNLVRLAHYPQNEHIVRKAERMGIMLWEEIPVWQSIDFANSDTREKAQTMLREMILRDINRCSVCFWGVANETKPSQPRNSFLQSLLYTGRSLDSSRLFVAAFDLAYYNAEKDRFVMDDPFISQLDVVAVNKYMGWYAPWPKEPKSLTWDVARGKPLVISEFGGEALYGQSGDPTVASSWSEDYQAQLYEDNLRMFSNIPNLVGVSPWVLFDFRSPFRFHPTNQDGWNRKGLVSDQGMHKKAWYIMRDYYVKKKLEYSNK